MMGLNDLKEPQDETAQWWNSIKMYKDKPGLRFHRVITV